MNNLDTLILSLTSVCNLRCDYCHNTAMYYGDDYQSRIRTIKLDVAKKAIVDYVEVIKKTDLKHAVVCFTGGEPLLFGIDRFRELVDLIDLLQDENGFVIQKNLQTNGTLISNEWCSFFKEHGVNVSMSIDGHPELTDRHRKPVDDFLTSERIENAASLLHDVDLQFGVLFVITSSSFGHEKRILRYLNSLKPKIISFTPCLDKGPFLQGNMAEAYGKFLCSLFDEWVRIGGKPDIRTFRYFVQKMTNAVRMNVPCEWFSDCPNTINITTCYVPN